MGRAETPWRGRGLPAQGHKLRTYLADRRPVVLTEIANRLVIGNQPAGEPHHLNVAGRLPFHAGPIEANPKYVPGHRARPRSGGICRGAWRSSMAGLPTESSAILSIEASPSGQRHAPEAPLRDYLPPRRIFRHRPWAASIGSANRPRSPRSGPLGRFLFRLSEGRLQPAPDPFPFSSLNPVRAARQSAIVGWVRQCLARANG